MSDPDRLQEKVAEYCNCYHINPVFKISERFDIERDLTAYYPNSNSAGCYAVYTGSGELLYIGKASNKHVMGFRLGNIWKLNADKTAYITKKDWGDKTPQIIQTIPVNEPYEASSLEEFLILKLQPPCNTIGRTKRDTAIDAD